MNDEPREQLQTSGAMMSEGSVLLEGLNETDSVKSKRLPPTRFRIVSPAVLERDQRWSRSLLLPALQCRLSARCNLEF